MLIKKPADIRPSEITGQNLYANRRRFMQGAAAATLAAGAPGLLGFAAHAQGKIQLPPVRKSLYSTSEPMNSFKDITTYNNFYEFGTDKYSPAQRAKSLRTRPWTIKVSGEVKRPKSFDVEELLKLASLEERIYRLRCVEAWSMVIPWIGYPLAELIKQVAILGFGLYGEVLPNPNGAPVRIVVPWKYGFKSAKSIVAIRFVEQPPVNSWQKSAPHEYGFYSNVNPTVDHPRWSQATERRVGKFFKRKTLMFNGYADQVAQFYTSMDLRKYY